MAQITKDTMIGELLRDQEQSLAAAAPAQT